MRRASRLRAVTLLSTAVTTLAMFTLGGRAGLATVAGAQAPATVLDGVYTGDQAKRGLAIFRERCVMCHGEKLEGALGPALVGADFMANWQGKSVDSLFQRVLLTMPADDPGKLAPKEAADLISYVLSENKFPAGQKELAGDREALKLIQIPAKK